MNDNLNNIVLDMTKHAPILKMNHANDYQHFLKDADQKNVKAMFYYGLDNHFDIYLAGGVVRSGMMNGKKVYSDIDMLAVAEGGIVRDLTLLLSGCHADFFKYDMKKNIFQPRNFKELSQMKGSYVFNANGQLFQTIGASTADKLYLNTEVEERFILMPLIPVSSSIEKVKKIERPSSIDLSLIDKRRFDREDYGGGYI